jgi:hypothetical protein
MKATCAPGGRSVSTRLAADRVQGEVVILSASEKDITVAFELAFAQHREAELSQGGFIHSTARWQIADSEANVIDRVAHCGRVYDDAVDSRAALFQARARTRCASVLSLDPASQVLRPLRS